MNRGYKREATDFEAAVSFPPAGYNNLEVAELLLEKGAEVNAQDKGGLIPLHNASSYGHLDVAALLIKHGTLVNATDRWGFGPLHEAAQKGRTQLCALLVSADLGQIKGHPRRNTPAPLCSWPTVQTPPLRTTRDTRHST